ncbi:MAG: hypothetical protein ACK5H1_01490 [Tenacibaculum sp.]
MPFIEETKYQLMQEDIDTAKLKLEKKEEELDEINESCKHQKQRLKTFIVLLGVFLALSLAIIYLLISGKLDIKTMTLNSSQKADIAKIKTEEAKRVLDSISLANNSSKAVTAISSNNIDRESTIATVKKNSHKKTIYSVQIGVFSSKNYPVLSKSILSGITTKNKQFIKLSLGIFTSLSQAKEMKNELLKMGFKDAFIASYINGERQQIHQ